MLCKSVIRRGLLSAAAFAAVLMVSIQSAMAVDARKPNAVALSDAEKAMIRDLIKLMWKMQREDSANTTLTACLNPATQMGEQTCYTKSMIRPLGMGPPVERETRIEDALKHYLQMMANDKLCKDTGRANGGWTYPQPGLGNDTVGISGPLLDTWKNPMADPVERAHAKFWIMATLANEIAHVYQKRAMPLAADPAAAAAERLRINCDAERDSDVMSIKFLDMLLERLKDGNTPHSSLGDIEDEGSGGRCVAMCLQSLGVTTGPQIQALTDQIRARKAVYDDRLANLFNNQINQGNSWRHLYGSTGVYKSPLRLKVDASMFQSMRQLKVMFGAAMATLTIPEDGKIPIAYIVTVNRQSQIIVIVITMGANGAVCMHTWTDTDFNGIPETHAAAVLFPPIIIPPAEDVPEQYDAYCMHQPFDMPDFNDPLVLHDTRNGVLTVFDLTDQGFATGEFRTLLRSPLIADPENGNPSAGGFRDLHGVQYIGSPDAPLQIRMTFRRDVSVDDDPNVPAVVGVFEPPASFHFQFPPSLAAALMPGNPIGLTQLPPPLEGLQFMSDPGDFIALESIGYGSLQLLTMATIPATGIAPGGFPPLQSGPDLILLTSMFNGASARYPVARHGLAGDIMQRQVTGGPSPDVLVVSDDPGRITVFSGDPSPNYQLMAEIVTQDPNPAMLEAASPSSPLSLVTLAGSVPLTPVAFSPLIAQTLADLDGDGLSNDAAVIARLSGEGPMQVFTVINAASPGPLWFASVTVPFEPSSFSYQNFNNDNRADLQIEDAMGGPPLCLTGQGFGGFTPGTCGPSCPADFNNSGQISVQDIFDFLAAFFMGNPAADFNHVGGITVQDLFDFLAAYFAGCP